MKIHILDLPPYRGFRIGHIEGGHGHKAAWKSSLEDRWNEGNLYVDSADEVPQLATDCIDFICRTEVEEVELGRKLTSEELVALHKRSK